MTVLEPHTTDFMLANRKNYILGLFLKFCKILKASKLLPGNSLIRLSRDRKGEGVTTHTSTIMLCLFRVIVCHTFPSGQERDTDRKVTRV